ncbi:hypothetical protein [Brachybacterium hainanense]|uniref:DUF4333 domain-containing protein n=1 Tax=Brachybacterium hainanense TaxID=1541174 RepID=A0ABV6RF07_9MICO
MSQPPPAPDQHAPAGGSRRIWVWAGCLFMVALLLVAIGLGVRYFLSPENDSYQRSTDVSGSAEPADGGEETADPASPAPEDALDLTAFVTPSGNIACTIDGGTVGCTVQEQRYPDDVACEDGPFSVRIADGAVERACGEDFTTEDAEELGYGSTTAAGSIACESTSDALTCWDTRTGHGVTLSRASYEEF